MNEKTEIYREKMIDAATNLILTKMEELRGDREELKEMKRRRWVWELIQNANDCSGDKQIDIVIQANCNRVIFSHNGECFTYQNMVDLITQISTKRKDEQKVGKFGTGFISTHLLSDKVKITGIYHSNSSSDKFKRMNLLLDRSGTNYEDVSKAINNAFDELDNIDLAQDVSYNKSSGEITTSFTYVYDSQDLEVLEAANKGYEDWERTIPLVLAFAQNIRTVKFNDILVEKNILGGSTENLKTFNVVFSKSGQVYKNKFITVSSNCEKKVDVACVSVWEENKWKLEEMQNYPKLFCNFPLIGTEKFAFPIVINSKEFRVSQERNDIHENVIENRVILEQAIYLYENLIEAWMNAKPENFFHLCKIKEDTTRSAYLCEYEKKIKNVYKQAKIVTTVDKFGNTTLNSLYINEKKNVVIPYYEKERNSFWQLFRFFFDKQIPREGEIEYWAEVCSENVIDLSKLKKRIINNDKIKDDLERIGEEKYLEALNNLNKLCLDHNSQTFPYDMKLLNQRFEFVDISKLMNDESDDELKDILLLFNNDVRRKLLHKGINIFNNNFERYRNQNIANELCAIIRRKLADESNGAQRKNEDQATFNRLTDWFLNNANEAKMLFADVYEKQHLLTQPEETIRRLKLANQVEDIMNKNNIDFSQLTDIVDKSGQLLSMIAQGKLDISPEIKQLLEHISYSNYYSKEKFDKMLERSIINVHKELLNNPLYKIPEHIEDWKKNKLSSTVFTAEKDEKEIQIVIRPSDGAKIIFYEDTEFEALDDCECELWTDNGMGKVMMITLGDLLKITGVTSIPLKKII
ncbi:hypothetical protein AALB47_25580 [Lachnospiraceae bacterium 54-11]